ncbi:MAG: polysaccharide deacetylase family protein [Paludibacteraceae bacterium]|nr:polysaccharide deacetylase family protein [Paludibacteraceae bacterium]
MKLRLQPIRVFCLNHVTKEFDPATMYECDWMQIDEFKNKVMSLQQSGVEFISLTEAHDKLQHDCFRRKKYAVITFDDGYASLKEILPWLEEQHIPAALFVNGKYLDGKSYRNNPQEKYLTKEELFTLVSPLLEIGSHGWEHTDASQMAQSDFDHSINRNVDILSTHPRYIPFHAYTWGNRNDSSNQILRNHSIIPILVDGEKNYINQTHIHRELLK